METACLLDDHDSLRFRGAHSHISITGGKDEERKVGLVAIFVVTFDTKAGNIVEWQVPMTHDLVGVEFKALVSGAHNVHSDFTYFRLGNLYGLSCYEKKILVKVEDGCHGKQMVDGGVGGDEFGGVGERNGKREVDEGVLIDFGDVELGGEGVGEGERDVDIIDVGGVKGSGGEVGKERRVVDERGSRMKSVGVLCHSYEELSSHFEFLKEQVHYLLDRPTDHYKLEQYWQKKHQDQDEYVVRSITSLHPAHSFVEFIRQYGVQVVTLWKLVLCGARILIYSSPPIGDKCFHVHCLSHLGKHHRHRSLPHHPTPHPLFYINVADIDQLNHTNYIACTTEKIFQMKEHLYDVIVVDGEVIATSAAFKNVAKVNQSDVQKYEELLAFSGGGGGWEGDEDGRLHDIDYIQYFSDLNDRILGTLLDHTGGEVGHNDLKLLPLHPSQDRPFILLLSEVYAIDVIVTIDNPCCPTST